MSSDPADLLPQARIRLAALELFGQQGYENTTVRQIAVRAGVSPGLVIHHFGSKKQLHEACDEQAVTFVESEKVAFMGGGMTPSLATYLQDNPEVAVYYAYLIRALRDGGQIADRVYARLCRMSADMMAEAEQLGLVRLPEDREAAAVILATWSAGFMILSDLFARRLGGRSLLEPEVFLRYGRTATDLFSGGVFTDEYAAQLRAATGPTPQGTTDERSGDPDQGPGQDLR